MLQYYANLNQLTWQEIMDMDAGVKHLYVYIYMYNVLAILSN